MDDCNTYNERALCPLSLCSDSSMDDCNSTRRKCLASLQRVQIPLWTIVTSFSMFPPTGITVQIPLWTIVTENLTMEETAIIIVQIPLWTIVTRRWLISRSRWPVQIPLWTIVTVSPPGIVKVEDCSDSSMDDCNSNNRKITWMFRVFRFLYGRL